MLETLKAARINRGIGQDAVATAVGISRVTLSALENNKHPIKIDVLLKLARFYQKDLNEFYFPQEEPK